MGSNDNGAVRQARFSGNVQVLAGNRSTVLFELLQSRRSLAGRLGWSSGGASDMASHSGLLMVMP